MHLKYYIIFTKIYNKLTEIVVTVIVILSCLTIDI